MGRGEQVGGRMDGLGVGEGRRGRSRKENEG